MSSFVAVTHSFHGILDDVFTSEQGNKSLAIPALYRTTDGIKWFGPTSVTLTTFAEASDEVAVFASAK